MIRLYTGARAPQPPVSAKLLPERRPSVAEVYQKDGSRLPGPRRSENLRQRVVQLARHKEVRSDLKKDSDVRDTVVSFSQVKDTSSAFGTRPKHGNERDPAVVELRNSARLSPFMPRRARPSGIKLRGGGVVDLSPDGRGQQRRPERLVLRELSTNTPSPARLPHSPALPRSENTHKAQARSDVTVMAETTLLDVAAGIDSFTKAGTSNTRKVQERKLTAALERAATGSSAKVATRFDLNQHGSENHRYRPQTSHKPKQPWSTKPAGPSDHSWGASHFQDVHRNSLDSPQIGGLLRATNTSLTSRNAQEPSKRTRACVSPVPRGALPNRSVRFQVDDSSSHDPLTETSGDNATRSPHPTADDQVCGVRGSAISSSVPHPSSESPRCRDYHKQAASMGLYRRRQQLKQKTFVVAFQTDENYIINSTAAASRTLGPSCALDDPDLGAKIARQPTPFGPRRTADKIDATLEERRVHSCSSQNSETGPCEAVTTPVPQVSTYVVEEDLARRLRDSGRTQPLALTLHNLSLHNALHQRRIERERVLLRRAQRQDMLAGEARAETQDGGDLWVNGLPESDIRLKRWLLEIQRQCDFRPLVTFKIPVQDSVRV